MVLNPDDVSLKSEAYLEAERLWALPDDLLGGTLRMREQRTKYLPQKQAEELGDYDSRVACSFLFNGYAKALDETTAKPFEKPVALQHEGELSEFLEMVEDDVDRSGKNVTAFAREVFREALHRGVTHVLVDFPRVEPGATLADRRRTKARPVFIHVQAPRLLGWRTEFLSDGTQSLSMVRIWEETQVPEGAYGEKIVQRVRVYTRETWEIHERSSTETDSTEIVRSSGPVVNPGPDLDESPQTVGLFTKKKDGRHSFGEVPLVTLYFERTGYLTGRPVFENVAHANLAHFQSTSRQRAYLDFARIGILARFGITESEAQDVVWGANQTLDFTKGPQEADAKLLEHQGHAIEAGRQDAKDLEEMMQLLSTAPMVQRATAITATGEARDESRSMSQAQAWVRDLEQFLIRCYEFAARWLGETLPEDFTIDVFSDFGVTQRAAEEAKMLLEACLSGKVTLATLLREWKRRGIFSEAFDADKELDDIEAQGPEMVEDQELPAPPGEEDEDEEDDEEQADGEEDEDEDE